LLIEFRFAGYSETAPPQGRYQASAHFFSRFVGLEPYKKQRLSGRHFLFDDLVILSPCHLVSPF